MPLAQPVFTQTSPQCKVAQVCVYVDDSASTEPVQCQEMTSAQLGLNAVVLNILAHLYSMGNYCKEKFFTWPFPPYTPPTPFTHLVPCYQVMVMYIIAIIIVSDVTVVTAILGMSPIQDGGSYLILACVGKSDGKRKQFKIMGISLFQGGDGGSDARATLSVCKE